MKKILALLMMFLISGNLMFAQTDGTTTEGTTATVSVQPKLNFQAVVRDGDNQLVYSTNVSTVITITYDGGTYTENHPSVTTNENGLLNLVIGEGETEDNLYDVDWSTATIKADITYSAPVILEDGSTKTDEMTVTVESPITAVPYALQAGSTRLNTDMIVSYISGIKLGTEADKYDVLKILDAIRNNEQNLKNDLKDTIVEYMKTRMDIAKEVFQYYLSHATVADVQNTYDEVMANPEAKAAILEVIKQFIKDHEADAIDIAKYYVENVTASQLLPLYNAFRNNTALESQAKVLVRHYLQEYLDANDYVSIDGCESVEICAIANADKPCPTSDAFIGTTSVVNNKLQTTITNPDNLSFGATYEVTYTVAGETVTATFAGHKDGATLIKAEEVIPEGATNVHGTITLHAYGCATDFSKTF
jgi:hypothetical protein